MNILVIGNGFDVAHGLKTKYDQFLDFVKNIESTEYFRNLSPELQSEYTSLINGNVWFEHFIKTKEERKNTKQNWIDFEAEISNVTQELDRIRNEFNSKNIHNKINYSTPISTSYKIISSCCKIEGATNEHYMSQTRLNNIKEKFVKDLNRLTRCLELYLSDFLDIVQCKKIPLFANANALDYVITFNYTDTYERLYLDKLSDMFYCGEKSKEEKIHYIHGKARFNEDIQNTIDKVLKEKLESISKEYENGKITYEAKEKKDEKIKIQTPKQIKLEECDLVLGIEEYLGKEDSQKDNEYIEFKKFYQRIYKGTGSTYTKWLQKCQGTGEEINVTIYGHSIATTDGDIIKNLIEAAATTTIYYYGKSALHDIILNLVQIIGEEKLIEMTSDDSKSGRIIFKSVP